MESYTLERSEKCYRQLWRVQPKFFDVRETTKTTPSERTWFAPSARRSGTLYATTRNQLINGSQDAPDRPWPRRLQGRPRLRRLLRRVVHRPHLSRRAPAPRSALVLGAARTQQAREHAHLNQVATLDEAKAEFEASWKQWKAWAGVEEIS